MSSWLSDVGDWFSDNSSWLKPIASIGVGAYTQSNKDNAQSKYEDYLREREEKNYQDTVAEINAYNSQLEAQNAAAGARAAAARQNEARRRRAAKRANKSLQKTYKEILGMYAPYKQVADTLLPQMSQTYQNSLGLQNALASYVSSPAQAAKLDAAVPAWAINVPLPDEVKLK